MAVQVKDDRVGDGRLEILVKGRGFISDQSIPTAAKIIGLPASTAGKRLKRLLTKYREKLLAEGIREP